MNLHFRKGIMEISTDKLDDSFSILSESHNLLLQTKHAFEIMHSRVHKNYNIAHLCPLIIGSDRRRFSIHEQKDANEFFNLYLDQIEALLEPSNNKTLVQDVFGGYLANEMICDECMHRREHEERFYSINLDIQNKRDIKSSLASYIEAEFMENEDAWDCEKCDKKMKARKRTTFKVLPNTLVFVLKRFQYKSNIK